MLILLVSVVVLITSKRKNTTEESIPTSDADQPISTSHNPYESAAAIVVGDAISISGSFESSLQYQVTSTSSTHSRSSVSDQLSVTEFSSIESLRLRPSYRILHGHQTEYESESNSTSLASYRDDQQEVTGNEYIHHRSMYYDIEESDAFDAEQERQDRELEELFNDMINTFNYTLPMISNIFGTTLAGILFNIIMYSMGFTLHLRLSD